jgi:hypothetical protein
MPRVPHNTCQRSGVHFSEVILTFTVDLAYFSRSTGKRVFFRAPNTTQHLLEVWGAFFRGDLDFEPTFQGQLENVFFRASNTTQHLLDFWVAFFGGDLDLEL